MRAVMVRTFGDPSVLRVEELPEPEPAANEVKIRVGAVIVARAKDVAARGGHHPFSRAIRLPHVFGAEHAGRVEGVGADVDPAWIGARVGVSAVLSCGRCKPCRRAREDACTSFELLGIHRPGAYAEYVTVPAANLHRLPDHLSLEEAAALAGNGPVAVAQLQAADLTAGAWALIPGVAGALGSTVAALAHSRGIRVLGLSRRGRAPGPTCEAILDPSDPGLADAVLEITGGEGVEAVLDNIGSPGLFAHYLPALARLGRVVVSGSLAHETVDVDLTSLYLASQAIIGIRTGNREQVTAFWEEVEAGFRLPEGQVTPLPLEDAALAHALVEDGASQGQLVLVP